ncbi:MAG: hypothetical protein JO246_14515 [Frankiaceae bacterium]|nr:hypothetical protein [Frankiaceae bacterium]MBV9871848.1 hypothetical protein [Frankiaceae bacterium]
MEDFTGDLADQVDEAFASTLTPPPCPPWCVEPASHPYEIVDPAEPFTQSRFHTALKRDYVGVTAYETNYDGRVTIDQPAIDMWTEEGTGISIEKARQVATELAEAISIYERISG